MRNIFKTGLLCVAVLLATSCSNDTDDKLEGKWQLQQTETNGNVQQTDTVFYNFQTSLFMYQIYNRATDSYPYSYGYKTVQDDGKLLLKVNQQAFIQMTDWSDTERIFTIEKLSGGSLVLSSEGKIYTFRKF